MIACAFPPTGGAGVQRTTKFAKYLVREGWCPIVFAADYVPQLPLDDTLLADLPSELEHHTLNAWDPTRRIERFFSPVKARLADQSFLASKVDGLEWRLGRFARWILARGIPDEQVFWAFRGYRRLRGMLDKRNAEAIYSTFSPASNHLLAWMLKRSKGLPWVADFRDLWTDDCRYVGRWWLRRRVDRRLENVFLRDADVVIATSDEQRNILAARRPEEARKFHTITNGVDLEDFDRLSFVTPNAQCRTSEKFMLTYVGQFRESQITHECFEGIRRFLDHSAEHRRRFEFRVVGQVSARLRLRISEMGLPLTLTGYVSHDEALREMLRADLLLLSSLTGVNASAVIPGKAFEYFASGRPVLLIGEEGSSVGRLLEQLRGGICTPRDPDAIAFALARLWRAWQAGEMPGGCDRNQLTPYGREALTRRLRLLLEWAVGGHTAYGRTECGKPLEGSESGWARCAEADSAVEVMT
jgi:glycosyltransferase involved in cell wall biosynthesis